MDRLLRNANAANIVTVARILLIPVIVVLLVVAVPYGYVFAIALFVVAAATDKLDGYLARSRDSVTTFGQFMDPLADKLLIAAPLIALVGMQRLAVWVAVVIIAREFAVVALRIVGLAQGVSIPADRYGKAKTLAQIVAVVSLMLPPALFSGPVATADAVLETVLLTVAVVLTVGSGVNYFWKARDLLHLPGTAR
ncbi:MAG TPA: CDP-diacylglycerol--glycerol-3-phosphate 3-phosphatidyltransferase [Thermoleophilia bacterium]|nr:CDP-diacylglycerol--glycerol-3-phosphate 3-phosphatidyltransferase [Thermoleophilia bacterium]HQG54036.1 CDP-diacylglycerol--glycerol-3-phosphate 3-phosphatidyltransferase [Thermoleophilia bacterium]